MKRSFLRMIALVLVICAMQCCVVPSATAAVNSVTYDFYADYKNGGYNHLYHYNPETDALSARSKIESDYLSGVSDWKIETFNGYANMNARGYVDMNMGANTYQVFRIKFPSTGKYNVTINYATTNELNKTTSEILGNREAEFYLIPAPSNSCSQNNIASMLSQKRAQWRFSCYDAAKTYQWKASDAVSYSFQANQEYFFIVGGGSMGGHVYLKNLAAQYAGAYEEAKELEYPRPVTLLEEALVQWDDDFLCTTEVNGEDYFAVPISGGKMYIYNLDTWELVNEVNTGIGTPRGIVADNDGVIYVAGDTYTLFIYDLNTWQGRKSAKFNTVATAGSLYDMHLGDDGMIYTGTDKGHILQYNPVTDVFTSLSHGLTGMGYTTSVIQRNKIEDGVENQYVYASMHTTERDYLVELKWDADSGAYKYNRKCDFTEKACSTYLSHMSMTNDGIIFGGSCGLLMAVDTDTMTLMDIKDQNGDTAPAVNSYVSEEVDGKYYYVAASGVNAERVLCIYDPDTRSVTKTSYHIGQYFDCLGKTVTLPDENGVESKHLIATSNAQQLIYFVNVNKDSVNYGKYWQSTPQNKPLVDTAAGAGNGVNSLTLSADGTKLYFGGFLSNEIIIYDLVSEQLLDQRYKANGIQTDAICVYDGQIYAGNYTEATLTKINLENIKAPTEYFSLHNTPFNQSRIHSIVAGNNKVFLGTFPYVYSYGGVLAWYELPEEGQTYGRTYVAAGPNPDNVYYSDNAHESGAVWKDRNGNVITKLSGTAEGQALDKLDGVDGVVLNQGIKDVAYRDGILYAATSRSGGTNTGMAANTSAVIIAYSIEEKRVIATCDLADYGFASPVPAISGIEFDDNGTLWGVASETLFTLDLTKTNDGYALNYNEKLSLSKLSYDLTQNRGNSDIRFKDGYLYVAFERIGGLCKVNMDNPTDYQMLMPEVNTNGQVPESFVVAEDENGNDNIYYLNGSALCMITVAPAEDEWSAARAVTEQIKTITPETVAQARQAYDALTLRQKSLVQNYEALEQREVEVFIQQIAALGEINWGKYAQVQNLLAAYKALPKSQQNKITNYPVLVNASRTLQLLESKAPAIVQNELGETYYYATLEDALAETTEGTIQLRYDVTANIVDVNMNAMLDLNGRTLTVKTIAGKVTDSSDGKGLIKVAKNTEDKQNAVLTTADNQLILWDNTTDMSGYRIFGYTFTNMGMDAHKDDALQSERAGSKVKSFWSDLTFENSRAYTLLASAAAHSDLTIGFEVSWTPKGGEKAQKTFDFVPAVVTDWALAEEGNGLNEDNYCFFIALSGFDAIEIDGLVEVKPILKTAFKEDIKEATRFYHDYSELEKLGLCYELGIGSLNDIVFGN